MFKVGDKIRNVSDDTPGVEIGGVYEIIHEGEWYVYFYDGNNHHRMSNPKHYELVKPKIEAENRDVKFGTKGIIKSTGEDIFIVTARKNRKWFVHKLGTYICEYIDPADIRLEHEPEDELIKFWEASHEQRMNKSLVFDSKGNQPCAIFFHDGQYCYMFSEKGATVLNEKNKYVDGSLHVKLPEL